MMDKKPTIRTNDWRPGCTVPVGWVFECIILILLASAAREMSLNVKRLANAIERMEQKNDLGL